MKNILCPGTTCSDLEDSPFWGICVDPLDVLQLSRVLSAAKAIVNCRLVANMLCLLVKCVFTFCSFRFPSILFKMTFSGVSSPQSFFCSVIVLLMSTYKTNLSDISLLHSSFGNVFPSGYSFHSGWCFYLHSGLGNEEGYSDSPKVQHYKSLEGKLDFLWQTVSQKLYSSSDLCVILLSHAFI